ncbi:MAG: hypothetical protein RL660_2968 [Bacteroidota bacterium]|jgi:ABC-type bacteriocin/lantibiotic exporter with double-glycine peptidase domain
MANQETPRPISRLWLLLRDHKNDIFNIYAYAVLGGLMQLVVPLGIQSIISFVMGATISTSIYILIAMVIVAVLLVGIFQINTMKIIEKIQQKIFVGNAFAFAENIPRMDLKSTDRIYLPEFVNRFFDTLNVQKGLSKILIEVPIASIQILFGLGLLSFYNPIFIGFGIILVFMLYLILQFTSRRGIQTSLKESSYKYSVVAWLQEMARIIKSFKFSQGTHLNLRKTDQDVLGYLDARTNHFKVLLLQYKILVVFKILITGFMLIAGTMLLLEQKLNVGAFIAAEIVILTILGAVEKLISSLDSVYDVVTGLEKVASVKETPLEKQGTQSFELHQDGIAVRLHNLSFGYEDKTTVLNNVNLDIKPGQKICFTGKDASGKTTLLKLLSGSYSDYSGMLHVNHQPLHSYNLQTLRQNTGTYLQHQDIFKGTVFENITLGKEAISANQVIELAKHLGIQDFLNNIPMGLDELLDPTGKRLSTKIIESILVLRALVHKPQLLLLEEPWLSFSDEVKAKMINYLLHQTPDTTVLIVTTESAFMSACDVHFELSNGTIVKVK